MRGKLIKISERWFINYVIEKYKGGIPKQLGSYNKMLEPKMLELTPEDQKYLNSLSQVNDNIRVEFKEVLLNPMGREVDPNDLGQNHSSCVWYAKLIDDSREIKPKDIFNDETISKVKDFIKEHSSKQSDGRILKNKLLGIQFKLEDYILKTENKELLPIYDSLKDCVTHFVPEIENDWEEILFDFIDFYPCILPHELFEWLEENYEIPKKKDGKD